MQLKNSGRKPVLQGIQTTKITTILKCYCTLIVIAKIIAKQQRNAKLTKYLRSSTFQVMQIHNPSLFIPWITEADVEVTAPMLSSFPTHSLTALPCCWHPGTSENYCLTIQLLEKNAKLNGSYLLLTNGLLTQSSYLDFKCRLNILAASFFQKMRYVVINFVTRVTRPVSYLWLWNSFQMTYLKKLRIHVVEDKMTHIF